MGDDLLIRACDTFAVHHPSQRGRRMMRRALLLLVLALPAVAGCAGDAEDIDETVRRFADLESRAIQMRERRFALADEIRFTQDTLLRADSAMGDGERRRLESKLLVLNKEKEEILHASLILADTVRASLDSIMRNQLVTVDRKKLFNEKLNAELVRRGYRHEQVRM